MSKRKRGMFWMFEWEGNTSVSAQEPEWDGSGCWCEYDEWLLPKAFSKEVFGFLPKLDEAVLIDLSKFDPRRGHERDCVVKSTFPPKGVDDE